MTHAGENQFSFSEAIDSLELFPQGVGIFPTPVAIRKAYLGHNMLRYHRCSVPVKPEYTIFQQSQLSGSYRLSVPSASLFPRDSVVCVPSGAEHPGLLLSTF